MNSIEALQDEYGVTTVWKDNRLHFTTPSKELISTVCGGEPDNRLWALMRTLTPTGSVTSRQRIKESSRIYHARS